MEKGTTFDISLTKEEALHLIKSKKAETNNIIIMCKEYGEDSDWCGIESEDYDEIAEDSTYQTFEIWLEEQTFEMIKELIER